MYKKMKLKVKYNFYDITNNANKKKGELELLVSSDLVIHSEIPYDLEYLRNLLFNMANLEGYTHADILDYEIN